MTNVVHEEKAKAKRSGEPEPDAAYNLDVFGNSYNLRLKRNTDLLAPNAKLVIKDGNHTYTQRITNSSYPVAWLVVDEDEEDGWGLDADEAPEDNSAMTECDNYIVRSTVAQWDGGISAVFSDCYETDEEDEEEGLGYEESNYYFPRRKETFRDLSGIVFDLGNKEAYEVHTVPLRIQEM